MTETQQRFLRAIAERVPMEHVIELHLFPPIRQGGVETGVAVVAEDPRRPPAVLDAPPSIDAIPALPFEAEPVDSAELNGVSDVQGLTDVSDAIEVDESPYASEASAVEASADDDDDDPDDDESDDDESDDYDDDSDDDDVDLDEEEEDDDVLTGAQESAARVAARYTIHTARYRLTLKGVDRGKWEVDVVAEADAPLDALDAVVRGVQRRAGEGAEPDRLSTDAIREALDAPLATLER